MSSISVLSPNLPPLAKRVRPQTLEDFIGQEDILHKKSILSIAAINNKPFSMIFWGPPGSGKTTLAKILSHEYSTAYFSLSAVSSGIKDIRKVIDKGEALFGLGKRTFLFIDEIHHFSRVQQDSLLNAVEEGIIMLIGATTENPSFEIISSLISRCQIFRLKPFNNNELKQILNRAITKDIILSQLQLEIDRNASSLVIESSGGDARKMLNTLELSISMISKNKKLLTAQNIQEALQEKKIIYDKNADYHYDVISAYIKSIRGSDPDAAVYWLAVMIEGGEKPEFIARRLIILASEDIGNAEPYALQLTTSAFDAVKKIGMPESQIILSQITTYLASAPKSKSAYNAIISARKCVKEIGNVSVPLHLRSTPSKLIKNEEFKNSHDYANHFIDQNYFPETFNSPIVFYIPGNEGREKFIKDRLKKIWKKRYN